MLQWCSAFFVSVYRVLGAVWKPLSGDHCGSFQCVACSTSYSKDVVFQGKRVHAHEQSVTHKRALKSFEKTVNPVADPESTSAHSEVVQGPLAELLSELKNPASQPDHVHDWVDPVTGTVDWNSDMMDVDLMNDSETYIRVGMELGGKLYEYLLDDGAVEEPSDTEVNDFSSDEGEDSHCQGW
jgi:hypothetical protein